jgi:hypothetical protein
MNYLELIQIIKKHPVEPGEIHPADAILNHMAKSSNDYLESIYLIFNSYPELRADLFKLISRLDNKYLDNLVFYNLARRHLNDSNIEVVDAAIGMFESFSNKSSLKEWLDCSPSQPKWILDYAVQVLNQDSSLHLMANHSTNS